jgi:hypothetical protein
MQIIEPLVNFGTYREQHERWYLIQGAHISFFPINAAAAHERFLQKWARQERVETKRMFRDAREQFLARMEAING